LSRKITAMSYEPVISSSSSTLDNNTQKEHTKSCTISIRKLSYCKNDDDCAMCLIYGCPENVRESEYAHVYLSRNF